MSAAAREHNAANGIEIPPGLPLALLESVRAHDRPGELLEEEDLSVSLPRRLGLTGVVEKQMAQYQQAAKRGGKVSLDDVTQLVRLMLRRPDAETILRETGQRVARLHFEKRFDPMSRVLGILPRGAALSALRRSARSMLTRYMGEQSVELGARPLTVRSGTCVPFLIDPTGLVCVMYAGAIEELAFMYTQNRPRVVHHVCRARGNDYCEWAIAE
jgi:hypothetical protein